MTESAHLGAPGPRITRRWVVAGAISAAVALAIAIDVIGPFDAGTTESTEAVATPEVPEYPDAIVRRLDRLAREPRPVERSALPPRHLDIEVFPVALVERDRIVSGGPPPDGIPSLDAPEFEPVSDVDWLGDREPVLLLDLEGTVRIYPLQVMIWHEIVNDRIDDRPVAITYCPLCNTGIAFDRRVGDRVLDFGVSGSLYQSGMVMFDRQSESLWTQVDGRSVVGELVGAELEMIPIAVVSWSTVLGSHPDATVLSRTGSLLSRYGQNPYGAYGTGEGPLPGFFSGSVDARLPPMERVVGIRDHDVVTAVAIERLAQVGTMSVAGDRRPLTVWHVPGTPWAIGAPRVGDADDTGATAVFDARLDGATLTFRRNGDVIVDDATGSSWNVLGRAVNGPLRGAQLDPVIHLDTFWFAWSTAHPETDVH